VRSVMIDHPNSWAKELETDGTIEKFIGVDMSLDESEIVRRTIGALMDTSLAKFLGRKAQNPIDGLCTFVELHTPTVAALAHLLDLPGSPLDAVAKARNKHDTRRLMKAAGLPSPPNCLVESTADLDKAAAEVGFPAVLKPVSGAASLGVKRVDNMQELVASYAEITKGLSALVVSSGALVVSKGRADEVAAESKTDLTVMLELYLDGPEIDCDIVMARGEPLFAEVSDNGPTVEPYFNETWGVCPSLLPKAQQAALKQLYVLVCVTFALRRSAFSLFFVLFGFSLLLI